MKSILHFRQEINRQSIERLLKVLGSWNAPDTVVIDSPGGTFNFFSVVGPAIARRGITTVADRVYSAATILFTLGSERIVHPNSEILFHEVRVIALGGRHITVSDVAKYEAILHQMSERPTEEFDEWQHQMRSAQAWFIRFIADHTGCPASMVRRLMETDTILTGREACQYGIATKYGDVNIYEE